MQEWLEGVFGLVATKKMLPFFCLAGKPEILKTRLAETAIMALVAGVVSGIVAGLFSSWILLAKMEERVDSQGKVIAEIKADIGKIKSDIYVPVGRGQ